MVKSGCPLIVRDCKERAFWTEAGILVRDQVIEVSGLDHSPAAPLTIATSRSPGAENKESGKELIAVLNMRSSFKPRIDQILLGREVKFGLLLI